MATQTISVTDLDFNNIRASLLEKLSAEFSQYNYEGSGIVSIVDVLAYNTHYNALVANFAVNESYLSSAQLRSSVVNLAQNIGYTPRSYTSALMEINVSLDLTGVAGRPESIVIPAGYSVVGTRGSESYTFQTRRNIIGYDNGTGIYTFQDAVDGSVDIPVYEGSSQSRTFQVGSSSDAAVYVITDRKIDISSLQVDVYESRNSPISTSYGNITEATSLTDQSALYVVRETSSGYYELLFGTGLLYESFPTAGNEIRVNYQRASGSEANGINVVTPQTVVTVNGIDYQTTVTTVSPSAGGAEKEDIDSIRLNAPFVYATQNRMVTAVDYATLAQRYYGQYIDDIFAWGGDQDPFPEFGVVKLSIRFKDNVSASLQQTIKDAITELASGLAVATFDIKFEEPQITYITVATTFQFNSSLTNLTTGQTQNLVRQAVSEYFAEETGRFGLSFRRSNMLTQVDAVDPAVLSSRAAVTMSQRIAPTLLVAADYTTSFPTAVLEPSSETSITSTPFTYAGSSVSCIIRNKQGSTTLEIAESTPPNNVIVDNIGSYVPTTGVINLRGFNPTAIAGGQSYITITAIPANQSAISPQFNNILEYDPATSFVTAVSVTST